MYLKLPKENSRISWTKHSKKKMRQYKLSEKRVLRVLRKAERKEEGIAPETFAQMQKTGTRKNPTEIWIMYILLRKPKGIKIISAWRYPGRSPVGKMPPIPEDTLEELEKMIKYT
jgi:hypothetical protein